MVAKYGLPGKEIEKAENSYVEAVCDGPVSNVVPEFKVVDGVADIEIHAEVFEDVEPLWKSFVVGYFMGDSPLIGSIHATVNRIWSMPKSKIDVQFISKRTVLFRIEDEQMRKRVLRRKYWHIADVPLVVSEWNPETAHDPPDLTAIPLWVDLVNVPGYLYSLEGLTFLSRTTWKFVKLHTNTERFARMDVPTVLVEVNLMKPLPEKICFKDKNQGSITVEVKYPWLPPRCTSCNGWGHIMIDCTKNLPIVLQRKQKSATGKEVVLKLLDDLERVDVRKQNLNMRKENNLQLVEVDPVEDEWERNGKSLSPRAGNISNRTDRVESPNGFQVLSDIKEEGEIEDDREDVVHQEDEIYIMVAKTEESLAVGKPTDSRAASSQTANQKGHDKDGRKQTLPNKSFIQAVKSSSNKKVSSKRK
ncbi:unnamed protein product [Brassica oleracea]